jgi:hypothetical protein
MDGHAPKVERGLIPRGNELHRQQIPRTGVLKSAVGFDNESEYHIIWQAMIAPQHELIAIRLGGAKQDWITNTNEHALRKTGPFAVLSYHRPV